ncbi:hypothetical protein WJX72_010732 [[Myrmecia] bisecta]|uniref:Uncharacterized protein n=1 Tax=[Myrmecia] bisecta TaxID=41462 RepID=A0AAW1PWT6_9CHLO
MKEITNPQAPLANRRIGVRNLNGRVMRALAVQLSGISLMLQHLGGDVLVDDAACELHDSLDHINPQEAMESLNLTLKPFSECAWAQESRADLAAMLAGLPPAPPRNLPKALLTLEALLAMLQEGPFTADTAHSRPINVAAATQFLKADGLPSVISRLCRMTGGVHCDHLPSHVESMSPEALRPSFDIPPDELWLGVDQLPQLPGALEEHAQNMRLPAHKTRCTRLRDAFWRINSLDDFKRLSPPALMHCLRERASGAPAIQNWTDVVLGRRKDLDPPTGARYGTMQLLLALSLDKEGFSLLMGQTTPANPKNKSPGAAVRDAVLKALGDDQDPSASQAAAALIEKASQHDSSFRAGQ